MLKPELVRDICHSVNRELDIPITVKCRLGVDNHDSYEELCNFIKIVSSSGVKHFIIHARKCLLNGISTDKNLSIPPIKYDWVYNLMNDFPDLDFSLNGNVKTIDEIKRHLQVEQNGKKLRGVMVGRAANTNPWTFYKVDQEIFNKPLLTYTRREILNKYIEYVQILNSTREKNHNLAVVTSPLTYFMKGCHNVSNFRRKLNHMVVIEKQTDLKYCLDECLKLIPDEDLDTIGEIDHNN